MPATMTATNARPADLLSDAVAAAQERHVAAASQRYRDLLTSPDTGPDDADELAELARTLGLDPADVEQHRKALADVADKSTKMRHLVVSSVAQSTIYPQLQPLRDAVREAEEALRRAEHRAMLLERSGRYYNDDKGDIRQLERQFPTLLAGSVEQADATAKADSTRLADHVKAVFEERPDLLAAMPAPNAIAEVHRLAEERAEQSADA